MKFLWLCLHDTYLKRKLSISSFNRFSDTVDVEVEIARESSLIDKSVTPAVIEGKDVTTNLIDLATECNAAVFVENYVINTMSIQTVKLLAVNGVPFFWELDDVLNYLRFLKEILHKEVKPSDLLDEMVKLESSFHSMNVSELSYQIAKRLFRSEDVLHVIRLAALLHDIGKLLLPRSFVNAPRQYTAIEKELVKFHCYYGISLLERINLNNFVTDPMVKDIIVNHHERIDGSGYPCMKKGDEISLPARIVAVADVSDALRSNRPYRTACDHDLAITYLKGKNGTFDGRIVEILEEVVIKNSDIWDKNNRHCF